MNRHSATAHNCSTLDLPAAPVGSRRIDRRAVQVGRQAEGRS